MLNNAPRQYSLWPKQIKLFLASRLLSVQLFLPRNFYLPCFSPFSGELLFILYSPVPKSDQLCLSPVVRSLTPQVEFPQSWLHKLQVSGLVLSS